MIGWSYAVCPKIFCVRFGAGSGKSRIYMIQRGGKKLVDKFFHETDIEVINISEFEHIANEFCYAREVLEAGILLPGDDKLEELRETGKHYSFKNDDFIVSFKFKSRNEVEIVSVVRVEDFYDQKGLKSFRPFVD